MKAFRTMMITGSLALVLAALTAFINGWYEKGMRNLQDGGGSKGFAVVELFTSEGCSSCPPADDFIERLEKDNYNKQIYILAYHVDYWDRLGWKDRFSDHAYSTRQQQYARLLNLPNIYTPQVIVNGRNEFVGSDEGPILQAIGTGLSHGAPSDLTLSARIEGDKIIVDYKVAGEGKKSELVLALVQKSAQSNIKAGENSGRSLSHVQIVRSLFHANLTSNNNESIVLNLPKDFNEKGWELIGFVQRTTDGRITAAARMDVGSRVTFNKWGNRERRSM